MLQRTKTQTTLESIVQRKRKMWHERQIEKKMIEEWKKGASK